MSDYMLHQLAKDRQHQLMADAQVANDSRQARKARRAARRRAKG